jgi:hypothetical protein
MSDENQKRCNSRSDQGSVTESGDPSQMNTDDEDLESAGRQGGRSLRLRGSQRRDAGSQRTTGQDGSGER